MDVERLLKLAAIERGRLIVEGPPPVSAHQWVGLQKAAAADDRQLLACAARVAPAGQALAVYEQLGGGYKTSADLTAGSRDQVKPANFAVPARSSDTGEAKYPVHDKQHAANALARVEQHGTMTEQQRVYAAIAKKFPGLAAKSSVPELRQATEKKGWAGGEDGAGATTKAVGSGWST